MIAQEEIDRAVETLAHNIAACVHSMLAARRMTVAELKAKLAALPVEHPRRESPDIVDYILRAEHPHKITTSFLADVAYALGFEWDFKITRLPNRGQLGTGSESAPGLAQCDTPAPARELSAEPSSPVIDDGNSR